MLHDYTSVYKLEGKSLSSALELHRRMRSELIPAFRALQAMKDGTDKLAMIKAVAEVTPILMGQNAVSIKDAVTAFRAGDFKPLVEAFKAKYKALYDEAGQNTRSIQVKHIDGGYPRAYAVTPTLYFSPANPQEIFMYVPVDYKGQSFEPQDARLLDRKQSDTIGMGLWAGGHSDPVPVVHRVDPYGVETPEDFDPSVSMCERHPAPFDHTKTEVLLTVFNNIQKYVVEVGALPGVETPDDIELKCEIITRANNRPGLLAAAFNKHTGERLTFKENAYFRPVPVGTMFDIQPQEKFAGGMALQSFFDAIPDLPADEIWKICDLADQQNFINPPPRPAGLRAGPP